VDGEGRHTQASWREWSDASLTRKLAQERFVELLRRSRNLRAVQAHLRHSDIQTTTVYTEMTQSELQKVVNLFDEDGK
jgi:site-specific recombinase XerC